MRTVSEINTLIDCGLGKIPCNLVLRNVNLVNVCSKEIYKTDIFIKGKRIVSIEPNAKLKAEKEIDCGGLYAVPGFIDGHMHYSSSMINPEAMAQAIIPKGTTTLCVDFMEFFYVTGGKVIDVMLENADRLPYRIAVEVPTRVPTAPGLETTGEIIGVEETKSHLAREATIALGEIVGQNFIPH